MNVCVNVGFNSVYRSCIPSRRSVECEGPYMFTYANHNASVGSIGFRKNEHLVPSFCVQLT